MLRGACKESEMSVTVDEDLLRDMLATAARTKNQVNIEFFSLSLSLESAR